MLCQCLFANAVRACPLSKIRNIHSQHATVGEILKKVCQQRVMHGNLLLDSEDFYTGAIAALCEGLTIVRRKLQENNQTVTSNAQSDSCYQNAVLSPRDVPLITRYHKLTAWRPQILYQGPAKQAIEYFAARGFPCPMYTNPADHIFMKVCTQTQPTTSSSRYRCLLTVIDPVCFLSFTVRLFNGSGR